MRDKASNIFTKAVHSGNIPTNIGSARPHIMPILSSVGYTYDTMNEADAALGGGPRDYIYARNGGPTQSAFEDAIAALEGAEAALCFGSGMAALHAALLTVAHSGGDLLIGEALYGTTRRLAQWLDANMDITVHIADLNDLEATQSLIQQVEPTALLCEVLTNPLARVTDLPAIIDMMHSVGGQVVVDNTFATPYLLRPLEHGADIVVHSATKFLNGHGDVLAGVLAGPADLCHVAYQQRTLMGATLGSFDAWLALRGLRTLPLRMRQACDNAAQVASWSGSQSAISRVYYPGDAEHPDHQIAARLFREGAYGAVLAFELAGADRAKTFAFVEALQLCQPVASLGDLSTYISHPATSSHRSLSDEERAAQGISEGMLRLSVGVEDAADIIADLEQALATL